MNAKVMSLVALVLSVWFGLLAFSIGLLPVPTFMEGLELPTTLAGLGDALAITDGIFTTLAIALGLVAILLQGKELKASNDASLEQAKALWVQMQQAQESNRLNALTARLQFLTADNERLERQANSLEGQIESLGRPEIGSEEAKKLERLWATLKNTGELRRAQVGEARTINEEVRLLL